MTGSKEGAIKWHHNSTKISCMKNPFSRSENNSMRIPYRGSKNYILGLMPNAVHHSYTN